MIRSAVSLLLVLGLLFSQLATAPHMHAAEFHLSTPHGSQPHFHLHRFLPVNRLDSAEPAHAPTGHAPGARHHCPYDHDADAFYLPDNSGEGDRSQTDCDTLSLPTVVLPSLTAEDRGSLERLTLTHDVLPPGCPLYLQHLALLN